MASRNSIKSDIKNGYYHIYNRGVEKRVIFEDEMDYKVFLSYTKEYLSPKTNIEKIVLVTFKDTVFKGVPRQPNNYHGKVELLAYCLMPNHFHLLIKQSEKGGMRNFVHSLLLRYSRYFNQKYKRVGPLFQGRYKAVSIDNDSYLLHLSRYIHLNPGEYLSNLVEGYSSYSDYLGLRNTLWLNTKTISAYFDQANGSDFKKVNSYKTFVEKSDDKSIVSILDGLTLE